MVRRKGVGYKAQSTENSEKKDRGRQSRTREIIFFFNNFYNEDEDEEDCSGALYRITSSIAAAKRKGENLSRT